MLFHDRAIIDGPARITREGHFVAKARVARANNVQDYMPHELGLAPKADGTPYRIFRPEAAVFAKDSLHSAVRRPIVMDHPAEDVTDQNRDKLSVGDTGGEILRDGETMVIPITVTGRDAVAAAQTTHREFSWGYSAELDLTPGKFGDQAYDGSITPPIYNHLAMCRSARGGHDLRIIDERTIPEKPAMKIKIGDAEVDLSDGAAVALAVGTLNANLADVQRTVGTLTADLVAAKTTIEARDGTIAALTQQVKDAEVTPAKLQALADARAKVITDAKAIAGAALIVDGKTDAEVRKAAVVAKLGDSAAAMSDAAIEGAFIALVPANSGKDALRDAITGQPVIVGDAASEYEAARAKQKHDLRDAWRQPASAAA